MVTLNFATSIVETAPAPATSGTSLIIRTGHGSRFVAGKATVYPASGTIDPTTGEVVTITPSGDTLTLVRARESTTARSIQAGDVIIQGLTAGMWDDLLRSCPASATTSNVISFTAVAGTTHLADPGGGTITGTLPTGAVNDQTRIVNVGAGTVSIAAPAGSPGGTGMTLTQWQAATLQCVATGTWIEVP